MFTHVKKLLKVLIKLRQKHNNELKVKCMAQNNQIHCLTINYSHTHEATNLG
jgi:hypothetical protein